MCKIRKINGVVWPEYQKTCHFEHLAATFNAFRPFTVKQRILSSSGLSHIILYMDTKIQLEISKIVRLVLSE